MSDAGWRDPNLDSVVLSQGSNLYYRFANIVKKKHWKIVILSVYFLDTTGFVVEAGPRRPKVATLPCGHLGH